MATGAVVKQIVKRSIPTGTALECGDLACFQCGTVLKGKPKMAFNRVEAIVYTCVNEEFGCSYEIVRIVPVQFATVTGIRPDGTKTQVPSEFGG